MHTGNGSGSDMIGQVAENNPILQCSSELLRRQRHFQSRLQILNVKIVISKNNWAVYRLAYLFELGNQNGFLLGLFSLPPHGEAQSSGWRQFLYRFRFLPPVVIVLGLTVPIGQL